MKKAQRRLNARPQNDLALVTSLGGQTRQHRYLAHLHSFLGLAITSLVVQVTVFAAVVYPAGWFTLEPFAIAVVALGSPVMISAMVLAAFRRHDAPVVSAAVVYASLFFAMVSIVSALRLQVSYSAILMCGCIGLFITCAMNYRFHSLSGDKVRIMPFEGAEHVRSRVPGSEILSASSFHGRDGNINFDILLTDETSYRTAEWAEFISRMHIAGVDIVTCDSFLERMSGSVNVAKFELFHIVYSPSQLLYARAKRYLDLGFVLLFLPLLLLISAAAALYIYVRDPGPVIFVQIRRGYGNRPFRMYKFRTMFQGTAGGSTVSDDPRIIPGCSILRKLRIDEIPQCYNILRGDMSLIGPRPVAEYVAKASIRAEPKYAYRCVVPPGITGWAQVKSGYASDTNEEITKLSYDLYYIRRFSIDLDLVILANTVKTVLFGSGAK